MSARVRQVYDWLYDILYRVLTLDHNRSARCGRTYVRAYVSRCFLVPRLSIARHVSRLES